MGMRRETKELIDLAITKLLISHPIFANLAARIGVEIIESEEKVLAWTDGKRIYINTKMVEEFNDDPIVTGESGKKYNRTVDVETMMFVISHELMHLIGMTNNRGEMLGLPRYGYTKQDQENHKLWNMATDYEINAALHNNESKDSNGRITASPVGRMPEWVLYESKYKDMNAETIYKELKETQKNNPSSGTGNGSGGNSSGDGQGGGDGESEWQTGGSVDGLGFSLDKHIPIDTDTQNEVAARVAEVYQSSKDQGVGDTAFERLMEIAFKPMPFNWKRALSKYIKNFVKANYTWNKPSRAGIANRIILPSSSTTPQLHVGIAIDTSGSVGDREVELMMNHVFTILQQFKTFQVDVWCCSTQVHPETFRTYTAKNKKNIKYFKMASDGGTYMKANFDFVREKYKGKDKLDMLIIMSDFYDNLDGDTTTTFEIPVVGLVIDHKDFKKPTKMKFEAYPFQI